MRVAFVTWSGLPSLSVDDQLTANVLRSRGIVVDACDWSDPAIDWSRYGRIVLRSCWDYHNRPEEFAAWLDSIEARRLPLANSAVVVSRNLHKSYLSTLGAAGVPVVPSLMLERGARADLVRLMDEIRCTRAVIKPAISASAHRTHVVSRLDQATLDDVLRDSDVLLQPFVEEVVSRGEWSLVFFCGRFSHSVLKRPKQGDFRVQGEYGGSAEPVRASDALIAAAERALRAATDDTLYARVDGVEVDGQFLLMELELIEPALFLATDAGAAARFADAVEDCAAWRGKR